MKFLIDECLRLSANRSSERERLSQRSIPVPSVVDVHVEFAGWERFCYRAAWSGQYGL